MWFSWLGRSAWKPTHAPCPCWFNVTRAPATPLRASSSLRFLGCDEDRAPRAGDADIGCRGPTRSPWRWWSASSENRTLFSFHNTLAPPTCGDDLTVCPVIYATRIDRYESHTSRPNPTFLVKFTQRKEFPVSFKILLWAWLAIPSGFEHRFHLRLLTSQVG